LAPGEIGYFAIMPQQIGIPFIITQHMHPAIIMSVIQSQQAWHIFSTIASPLVHVIITPPSIFSHLQVAPIIPMLQAQQHMPFIRQQQEHIAPGIMAHRL